MTSSNPTGRVPQERSFELWVLPQGRRYRVIARSSTGTAEATVDSLKGIKADTEQLQNSLLQSPIPKRGGVAPRRTGGSDDRIVEELGAKLFSFLFSGEIWASYQKNIEEAERAQESIRIRLRIDDEARELATVPWEALYDPRSRSFLATQQRSVFTRAVDAGDKPLRQPNCMNILGMVSTPTNLNGHPLALIEGDEERAKVGDALSDLERGGRVKLWWTGSGSLRNLRRGLRNDDALREGWHIFHFIGHGDFETARRMGYLILESEGGLEGDRLYAEALAAMLTAPGGPQLVILNACNGARSAEGDLFSSTAAMLALNGVPAVIAMQFPVSDPMAITFARKFYELLADGFAIHHALSQTRLELKNDDFAEWVTPVLFMRGSHGQVIRS